MEGMENAAAAASSRRKRFLACMMCFMLRIKGRYNLSPSARRKCVSAPEVPTSKDR
jgi:hypothetical protein